MSKEVDRLQEIIKLMKDEKVVRVKYKDVEIELLPHQLFEESEKAKQEDEDNLFKL